MNAAVNKIKSSALFSKSMVWGKLIAITGSAQMMVQGLGLLSGILIIRLLPTNEYALYTLVNTMFGTMVILTDGGIGTSVMAQGGRVWKDRDKLGTVLVTGYALRKKFAIFSLLFAIPVLLYLLLHHGSGWFKALLIIGALIPTFTSSLSDSLLEIAPKLRQDITPLQRNQVSVSIGRLALTALTIFVFPFAYIAILATGIPRILGNLKLRSISKNYANWNQKPDKAVEDEIYSIVKRLLPTGIYYCISSQISIWLISVFGSTTAIAQIGALGRLSVLLTIFTTVFNTLIVPRFARLPNKSSLLIIRYLQTQGLLVVVSLISIGIVFVWPKQILWIIGSKYTNLQTELVLIIVSSCISLIAAVSFTLYTSRGWAIKPLISIPLNILAIVIGAWLLNVSTVKGVLLLNIFTATIQLIMNSIYILYKFKTIEPEAAPQI